MLQRKANVVFFWNAVPFGRSPSPPSIGGNRYFRFSLPDGLCYCVADARAAMLDRRRFRLRSRHLEHTICVSCQKEVSRSGREGGPIGRHRPPSPSLFCRGYVKRGATNRYRIVFGLGAMQSIKRPSIPPPESRPRARPIDRSECRIDGNFPRKLERRALSTAPSPAAISRWSVGWGSHFFEWQSLPAPPSPSSPSAPTAAAAKSLPTPTLLLPPRLPRTL